jgi:hypothetical protein
LLPNPPKLIFATPIANVAPIATIYKGMPEGRLSANSRPVSAADRSHIAGWVFNTYFCNTHSKPTHTHTETSVTKRALTPKKYTETPKAGSKAMITSLIKRCVVTLSWIWGDGDTINFFSIQSPFQIIAAKVTVFFQTAIFWCRWSQISKCIPLISDQLSFYLFERFVFCFVESIIF